MWSKINILRRLYRVSFFKTLLLNFYKLPLKQAVKLPIIVSRNTYYYDLSGSIIFQGDVKFGMIRFGFMGEDTNVWKNNRVLINVSGKLIFTGSVRFGVGVSLRVEKQGILQMGNNILINYNSKLICYDKITIGDDCNIAWDVQILDTDLHFIENIETNFIPSRTSPVEIGKHIWIGNRVSIQKGTKIPDYCIIASGSLVNTKSECSENDIIAGIPAKVVRHNYRYLFCEDENSIINSFNYK